MDFLNLYKHLLPRALAWTLTAVKPLRQFFEGLSFAVVKTYFDDIWLDIFPGTTRDITGWEKSFGLPDYDLTEQERRDRLDARWKEFGGQDPKSIQDRLQAAGFDVYVHQWWVPGTEPPIGVEGCAVARNPIPLLKSDISFDMEMGSEVAEMGDPNAEMGPYLEQPGYILVNKDSTFDSHAVMEMGSDEAEMGGDDSEMGLLVVDTNENIHMTRDQSKWPFFLYIGAETFPDLAQLPASKRAEFEELCLKMRPLQQWLGMLVEYF